MKALLLVALCVLYVRAKRKTFLIETYDSPLVAPDIKSFEENMFDYPNTRSICGRYISNAHNNGSKSEHRPIQHKPWHIQTMT